MSFDIVTIRVGDAEAATDLPVYRELLSAASPYFRAAFEGGFKEAEQRLITLDDVSKQTFRLFLTWLHAQREQSTMNTVATVPNSKILLPAGVVVQQLVQATLLSATTITMITIARTTLMTVAAPSGQ